VSIAIGPLRITIEGPQGAGKSFVARILDEALERVGFDEVTTIDSETFVLQPIPCDGVLIQTRYAEASVKPLNASEVIALETYVGNLEPLTLRRLIATAKIGAKK
jgi:hypothetical protein